MEANLAGLSEGVHLGDCVAGLKSLPDGCIDLAFADPPFNIGYDYDTYDDQQDDSAYLNWCGEWMAELYRVLKPNGSFWLAIGDEYAAELKVKAHREIGFMPRSWVIWYYTFGVHCKTKFTRSHAHLLYFTKDAKNFTFRPETLHVPSARQLIYKDKRANPIGRMPDDTWILRPQDVPEGFGPESDTWFVSRVCGTFKERAGWHGCQMPERVLARIINACSNEGDWVIDPFTGSGTTLTVARKLGRKTLGFELSEEYAKRATERLAAARPGDALEGGSDTPWAVPSEKVSRESPNAAKIRLARKKKQSEATELFE
jgi:site-specific DNA-methyltransferase (adenine-specific)